MDYINGWIFPSRGNIVIDAGIKEYSLDSLESFEIWDGEKYVPSNKAEIKIPQMTGTRARFKVTQSIK